ncbi:MAG: valine--tRNA ligase, partial [Muribaculaceae bacterium]|nr:valine--tRNA ligase [Muribaculaceae bacterium]
MKELATKYNPADVEQKWYDYWMENRLFESHPDNRPAYTIVIPPPNVTGVLHMGHMLNNTIQDILVRRARMQGKNALWVPGTDHASISTETKVIAKLAADGIKKTDISREEFLKHAWEWTEKYGGIILQQLRKLGASCDWSRTAFTMDETRSESVIKVFCDLYDKGLIYRGMRMVNWDPQNRTAISDDEVFFEEEQSKLYYLRYYLADDDLTGETGSEEEVVHRDAQGRRYAVVATTRPETIMGDTAMCINPKDPKNTWLKGKKVIVPLVNRVIPVIEDRYVEIDFGTGCLKVTPAHDKNDNMLGKTHNLETIDIFNEDGTVSDVSPLYVGMDRFDVRKQIAVDLEAAGLMEKVEDYVNKVGLSERTKVPIEPRLSLQWFIKMKHFAEIALPPVENDIIRFVPEKYKTTYRLWLENIQDWCISRQLWWGHRIPAYYYEDADGETRIAVAPTAAEALEKARKESGRDDLQPGDLRQDEDALDTWFSSWLWPITLFNGILDPDNEEMKYYYPTATLVTGPDIIFFWVARMIMAGYEYAGDKPFDNVYFTGIVRDAIGRKMSKMLGNSPDPLDLISTYGADGVRMGLMLAAPAGNDIMYDDKLVEQGRNFCNKIWNSFRLMLGWETDESLAQPEVSALAARWFEARLNATIAEVNDDFEKFRINDALKAVYRLLRDDYSSWYLEMIKPAYGSPVDGKTLSEALDYFDRLLRLLHPFMPFITEELWQNLADRKPGESIMYAPMPEAGEVDERLLAQVENAQEIIAGIRGVRAAKNIAPKESLVLNVVGEGIEAVTREMVKKLGNLSEFNAAAEKDAAAASFLVGTTEYNVPLADSIDVEAERARINKEIDYLVGFKASVEKKLSNERFVSKAPAAVVEVERRKLSDADQKLAALRATLEALALEREVSSDTLTD